MFKYENNDVNDNVSRFLISRVEYVIDTYFVRVSRLYNVVILIVLYGGT